MWWARCSKLLKFQHCILQLDAAGSAIVSELSQLPLGTQLLWVRARWAGRGQFVQSWLCSPTNSSCQPSMPDFCIPPPVIGVGPVRPAAPRGMFLRPQFWGLQMLCRVSRHSLLLLPGQLRGGSQVPCLCSCLVTAPALCLCPFPDAAVACADHSGRNAECACCALTPLQSQVLESLE